MKHYDVVIIGAGVIGCAIARELTQYDLSLAVLEKENDVCNVTSMANSAIVHSGYDPKPGTLKAKFNVLGNPMFDQICQDLDVEFSRPGSLTVATTMEEIEVLKTLEENAKQNDVVVQLLNAEEVRAKEPFLSDQVIGALFAPTCGIVNPFELTIGYMENAIENGAELFLNEPVVKIEKHNQGFEITTSNGTIFHANIVVNAAGLQSDTISKLAGGISFDIFPRKGMYYVLDHFKMPFVKHTIFPVPSSSGKGVLVTPTTHGNYLVGPTSDYVQETDDFATDRLSLDYIKMMALKMVPNIPFQHTIRSFAGLRAIASGNDFILGEDACQPGLFQVAGIQSPGLAASPAIARYIQSLICDKIKPSINKKFQPKRRPLYRLKSKTIEEKSALIATNPSFGRIICRCEHISEGEIVDAIHRSCGARSVKGVKKRVRPGFGKCQGGFCEPLVVKLLARELGISPIEVPYDRNQATILQKETKHIEGGRLTDEKL